VSQRYRVTTGSGSLFVFKELAPDNEACILWLALWPPRVDIWWAVLFDAPACKAALEHKARLTKLRRRYPN
jgi:hypothetical protein